MITDHLTPIAIAGLVSVVLCVVLLAAVIAKAVTGRREMSISLRWLGLSLNIDASNGRDEAGKG